MYDPKVPFLKEGSQACYDKVCPFCDRLLYASFGEWGHPFSSADNEEDCPVCGEKLLYSTDKNGRIRDLVEYHQSIAPLPLEDTEPDYPQPYSYEYELRCTED